MKMVKDKQILVAADFGGFELKEAVVKHLKERGWTVTDVGMKAGDTGEPEMYQRIGLRAGAMVAEGEFERALLFCGTGMGIHIAASKCPHVHSAVVETVPAALRCVIMWPRVREWPWRMHSWSISWAPAMRTGKASTNIISLDMMSWRISIMKNIRQMVFR